MDYTDYETSTAEGRPVEAVHFYINGVDYRYASGDEVETINGHDYDPIPMSREAFVLSGDSIKSNLTIKLPRDVPAAYVSGPSSVTVYRQHYDQFLVYWKGRVIGKEFAEAEVHFRLESSRTTLRRPGLRTKFQVVCGRVLYENGCNVNRATYKVQRTITAISGSTVTCDLSGYATGWFVGGYISIGPYTRTIMGHVGDNIQIERSVPGLAVGQSLDIYPGCDHTRQTCHDKFGNILNSNGYFWIPKTNPFSGLGNSLL